MGLAYALLQQNSRAIKFLDKAIEINPQYAGGYKIRAYYYNYLKNPQQTHKDWLKAASLYKQQGNTSEYQSMQQQLEKLNDLLNK